MRNFQDTFETYKRTFISAFSVCMTVPLSSSFITDAYDNMENILFLVFIYFSQVR